MTTEVIPGKKAADIIGVSVQAVYGLANKGRIERSPLGGYTRASVEAYAANRKKPGRKAGKGKPARAGQSTRVKAGKKVLPAGVDVSRLSSGELVALVKAAKSEAVRRESEARSVMAVFQG